MTGLPARTVAAEDWRAEAAAAQAEGLVYLDLLAAIDRVVEREVVVHLVDPATGRRRLLATRVPAEAPRLASLAGLFPAAAWHEREAAEMVGVEFDGHPDPRPLLLHPPPARPPLLVSVPLDARLSTAWPGAAEEREGRRARRPQAPPGVRAGWLAEGAS